jgi:hypothetical protein
VRPGEDFESGSFSGLLDRALRENPHYANCRDLGQLGSPRVFRVLRDAYATYLAAMSEAGRRIGEVKPVALDGRRDWSTRFRGDYIASPGI